MNFGKDRPIWQLKWHIAIIYVALIVVVLLTFLTDIFRTSEPGSIPQVVWLLAAVVFLITLIIMLSRVFKILESIQENGSRMERVVETLEKTRAALAQVNQTIRLSETARAIAFRDADRQSLREAVFDKLQQQDFETTYEIIAEIAHSTGYQELAEQLRTQAKKYQDATDQERVNQLIEHIEKLFENYEWAKASVQIERLIKAAPKSEKAKAMRQKLLDKKGERKKMLLTAWDDAVKRQATDRSLEILRELDLYLNPNEGLALQEAARDAFRTKLHNLGVQFSLVVSARQWARALEIGQQIVRDFPNSKMAGEIRGKLDILKQRVEQQSG